MSVPGFASAMSSYLFQIELFFSFSQDERGVDICAYLAFCFSAVMCSYSSQCANGCL